MGDPSHWLRGKEKNKAILTRLCQDPQFRVADNRWTVTFNVFRSDGGVDEWTVIGVHDSESRTNKIEKMEGRQLRPRGTFFYPLAG
jgi:hypothetical protein